MHCNKDLVDCECPEIEATIAGLKNCDFLDPRMIENVQQARAEKFLAKHDKKEN